MHTFHLNYLGHLGLALQCSPSIKLKLLKLCNQGLNCDIACRFLDLLRESSSGATLTELDLRLNSFCTRYSLTGAFVPELDLRPVLRCQVLMGEGLQDTDEHWQCFVRMTQWMRSAPDARYTARKTSSFVGFELA